MIDKVKWFIKPTANGSYVEMPQPTEFSIEVEDLDVDSYRSITSGNLIDKVISKNWSKCKFVFEALTLSEATSILSKCSSNPIYAKIENPLYAGGFLEAQFRCSRKQIGKLKTGMALYNVSLNLVQKNKVAGM